MVNNACIVAGSTDDYLKKLSRSRRHEEIFDSVFIVFAVRAIDNGMSLLASALFYKFLPFVYNKINKENGVKKIDIQYSFKDIAGNVPKELLDLCTLLKRVHSKDQENERLNAIIPKGILLYGPPGTGKTSIARALAGELQDCAFIPTTGPDFFDGQLIGEGVKKVDEIFSQARSALKDHKWVIIFIDEIDSFSRRGTGFGNAGQNASNTVSSLLTELDGFQDKENVIVIGSTNYPDNIDSALKRSGRLGHHIEIPLPDKNSRCAIIKKYAQKYRCNNDILENSFIKEVAEYTSGFSPADIEQMFKNANISAEIDDCVRVAPMDVMNSLSNMYLNFYKEKGVTKGNLFKTPAIFVKKKQNLMQKFEEGQQALNLVKGKTTMDLLPAIIVDGDPKSWTQEKNYLYVNDK